MKRLLQLPLLFSILLLAQTQGCGCDEEPLEKVVCDYVVTPSGQSDSIAFPETEVGGERVRTLSIERIIMVHMLWVPLSSSLRSATGITMRWLLPTTLASRSTPKNTSQLGSNRLLQVLTSQVPSPLATHRLPVSFVRHFKHSQEGSAYERWPVSRTPYDGGTTEPPEPTLDGGTNPGEDPPDVVVVDGGTFVGPDGGLIPYTPPEEEDAGVEEEEDPVIPFIPDGGAYPLTDNSIFVARGALQHARTGFAMVQLEK